uniref:Putative secreted peptide n=1 Tax=Anopheles braziliensis TaxID=58242 RepID=A0A2M3ZSX3_9DIPT
MGWRKGKAFLMSLPLGIPPRRTCPCCSNIHFLLPLLRCLSRGLLQSYLARVHFRHVKEHHRGRELGYFVEVNRILAIEVHIGERHLAASGCQ